MSFGQIGSDIERPSDLVKLGHVMSAFGVQGWIKVRPYTDGYETLTAAQRWLLGTPESRTGSRASVIVPMEIEQSRQHSNTIIALPKGYDDRDQAQALQGHTVWLPRSEFEPLPEGEYYWVDLLGCDVYGERGSQEEAQLGEPVFLGRVSHVFDNGAHAVLVVDEGELSPARVFAPALDRRNRPRQRLLPFVEAYVHEVDLANKHISTSWPEDF